jgi:hypothetical protein
MTLCSFGPGFGLPDSGPVVMKVETLLKMAKLSSRTDTTGFRQGADTPVISVIKQP